MQTYFWNNNNQNSELSKMIFDSCVPSSGECVLKFVEPFRKSSKLYYDHYNNGSGNVAECYREYWTEVFAMKDKFSDEIVQKAFDVANRIYTNHFKAHDEYESTWGCPYNCDEYEEEGDCDCDCKEYPGDCIDNKELGQALEVICDSIIIHTADELGILDDEKVSEESLKHFVDVKVSLPLPIKVKFAGENGDAFSIIGRVTQAMRRGGFKEHIEPFKKEAMNGDYDHLLQTCINYVEVR